MVREILFRGKLLDSKDWVFGYYLKMQNVPTIKDCNKEGYDTFYLVNPKTIGQFTELTDKNGTRIFEGDILQDNDYGICTPDCGVITYEGTGFCAMKDNGYYLLDVYELEGSACMYEVIGNIYDNPELLTHQHEDKGE